MRAAWRLLPALLPVSVLMAAVIERVPLDRFFFYEQNRGQAPENIRFILRGVPNPTYLSSDSIVLNSGYIAGELAVRFAAAGFTPSAVPVEPWPGVLNRFGAGSSRRAIPAYRRVQYSNIHPNIDLIFGGSAGHAKLTFVVRPGGDPTTLALETVTPNSRGTLDDDGGWRAQVTFSAGTFRKPVAWQEAGGNRMTLDAAYSPASDRETRFEVAAFDPARPLFIELELDLHVGPAQPFRRGSFAVDGGGKVYVTGSFPSARVCSTGPGGLQSYCPDAFVAAFHRNGEPVFVTVLTGQFENTGSSLLLDPAGNVVIVGNTTSSDFPTTPNAHQAENRGPLGPRPLLFIGNLGDLFLARLYAPNGDLVYSSYFGGPQGEAVTHAASGPDGSVAILASTGGQFPTTPGSWMPSAGCESCPAQAIVRFGASLDRLLLSTFVPGALTELAVHTDASIYLAGSAGDRVPTTKGALQEEFAGGGRDAYIIRLAADGSKPLFASYLGGAGVEFARAIAVDSNGHAWLYVVQSSPGGPSSASLVQLLESGSGLLQGQTVLSGQLSGAQLHLSPAGQVLLVDSATYPILSTTPGAPLRAGCGASLHTHVRVLNADATVSFASYLPSQLEGFPAGSALSPSGTLYRGSPERMERLNLNAEPQFDLACLTGAASRQNHSRVSPGQIVTLIGSRIGPEEGVSAEPSGGRYPTSLAGVRVLVNGEPAPLLYVQASQINAIVPYAARPGTSAKIAVEYEGHFVVLENSVIPAAYELFTMDTSGRGQAAALNQDGSLNSAANPAAPGSIVVLYGTGAGATTPDSADGEVTPIADPALLPKPAGQVHVSLNGIPAEVLYAGAAPGIVAGVSQINIRIPDSFQPPPSNVPVTVLIGGAAPSTFATIAIR
jgi:uncharacterized protein (TIGR03437 family)